MVIIYFSVFTTSLACFFEDIYSTLLNLPPHRSFFAKDAGIEFGLLDVAEIAAKSWFSSSKNANMYYSLRKNTVVIRKINRGSVSSDRKYKRSKILFFEHV